MGETKPFKSRKVLTEDYNILYKIPVNSRTDLANLKYKLMSRLTWHNFFLNEVIAAAVIVPMNYLYMYL